MSNPFVASKETCEFMQSQIHKSYFSRNNISVEFETDPDFLRELLPPVFEMPDRPLASVAAGKWQMSLGGEFDAASVSFQCKYKHIQQDATYTVVLYLESDMANFIGREAWGEPKKDGITQLYKCGSDVYAFAERKGVRLIEIEAELGDDIGPAEGVYYNLEIKASPSCQGRGFEWTPKIYVMENHVQHFVQMPAKFGELKLHSGPFDPLGEIPVIKTLGFTYRESKTWSTVPFREDMSDPERHIPYFYGIMYDDICHGRISKIFKNDK